ncbi:hypothetical protein AKJ29_15230 [Aliiroseovarius crassostreae]|uniref:Uncharacterized protein n=1 Tax=Aliiroseovarius crassostreae TaxID=154981 RepID=A0A0P7JRH3_9RHOB|nr:hypothetical protein AKJ29_15230 [Aliiroseovarius crassostreae]
MAQPIRIEGTVGQHVTRVQPIQQIWHTAQVVSLAWQQAEVGEVSKRVSHGQYFGGDTAVRLAYGLALRPPFAPWPAR